MRFASFGRVKSIILKEFRELRRDRIGRVVVFAVPLTIMLIFGAGLAVDVERIPFSVVDGDRSALSRELSYRFIENRRYFDFRGTCSSQKELENLIYRGKVRFGIVIPYRFERKLLRSGRSTVQFLIDGTFPYRGQVMKVYSEAIVNSFNLDMNGGLKLPVKTEMRYWFNEELKQKFLTASGTLAVVLAISPAILASLLVVKEKERGSIYNVFTSSITKFEFLIAKQLFASIVSILNFFILFALTVTAFNVPFRGSFPLFLISSILFILVSTSLGLLVSTFVRTQVTAIVGTILITVIPSFLYSGYLTPVSSMSKGTFIQAHLFPIYYYLKIIKGCYLKAAGLKTLLPDMAALLLFYILLFSVTHRLFKKRER